VQKEERKRQGFGPDGLSLMYCPVTQQDEHGVCGTKAVFVPPSLLPSDKTNQYCFKHLDRIQIGEEQWRDAIAAYIRQSGSLNKVSLAEARIGGSEESRLRFPPDFVFDGAECTSTCFQWCILEFCRFVGNTVLTGARFENCVLENADFGLPRIDDVAFIDCTLKNSHWGNRDYAKTHDVRDRMLASCKFRGVSFIDCELSGALLWNVEMDDCNFSGSEQSAFGHVQGGSFTNMDFTGFNPFASADILAPITLKNIVFPAWFKDAYQAIERDQLIAPESCNVKFIAVPSVDVPSPSLLANNPNFVYACPQRGTGRRGKRKSLPSTIEIAPWAEERETIISQRHSIIQIPSTPRPLVKNAFGILAFVLMVLIISLSMGMSSFWANLLGIASAILGSIAVLMHPTEK